MFHFGMIIKMFAITIRFNLSYGNNRPEFSSIMLAKHERELAI
jgi:hypothetical protein